MPTTKTQQMKEIRRAAGVSQIQVAVETHTSLPTVRLFEASPSAVSDEKRAALTPYYGRMAQRIALRDAG